MQGKSLENLGWCILMHLTDPFLTFLRQMVNLKGSILSSREEKYFKMCKTEESELKEDQDPILAKL